MSEPKPSPPPNLPPLRETIARYGLSARKALGQHFLLDLNLTGRIARAAQGTGGPLQEGTVVEVGPGPGGLTRVLLAAGARRLVVIEKDQRCLAALAELAAAYPGRLEIVEGDALEIDAATLGPAPRKIVANLPYNVATPLLIGWLAALRRDPAAFASLTLMFQKEVALRLVAVPGGKDYGRLAVMTQWLTAVRLLFDVPARAFTPPPKVTSSVVQLVPRPADPQAPTFAAPSFNSMERVVGAAFGQRRKMLRQALKVLGGDPLPLLAAAGIDETARAEQLTVNQFCALAKAFEARSSF